jgi:GxxExxY protein
MELLEKDLTEQIIAASYEVTYELGCGFLESVYQNALLISLAERGLTAVQEMPLKIQFHGKPVGDFYSDITVEKRVIIEVKAVRCLLSEHEAQLLNYLKATGIPVGLLINFGKPRLEWRRRVFTIKSASSAYSAVKS